MLDTEEFPNVLSKGGNLVGAAGRAHNLELLLHMIDPDRDPALCNKSEDALVVSPCNPEPLTKLLLLLLFQSVCMDCAGVFHRCQAVRNTLQLEVDESDLTQAGVSWIM